MSGHSHWAGIKHKKAAIDAKRGRLWSKLARAIIVAAKNGGGDPDANLTLRYAIDKAKDANMPKDTIEKAVKKGTGGLEGVHFEEVLYEGYGNDGVAIMCEALTDNRKRTGPELKRIFEGKGGALGSSGCVSWMFSQKGLFSIDAGSADEDMVMEIALEAGADNFERVANNYEITCAVDAYAAVKAALQEKNIPTLVAEISREPSNTIKLDEHGARKILSLLEMLEDHEDIQNVYANFDIPDEIMKKLEE
jgi:YebC/PmpR family DNA-binding regulatory protein